MSGPSAQTRSVVIVSPYFPPSSVAGVHRARHLANRLPAAGWTPIVLCVDEARHAEKLDPDLAGLVRPDVEVVRTDAIRPAAARRLGLGDLSLRAWPQLRGVLHHLVGRRQVRAVLITGAPFYPMLMAPGLVRRFGVPVVLDFQDPWVSHWGGLQSPFSKAGLAHRAATVCEPRALRGASFVTSVSDEQNRQMADRYAWLDPERMAAIPIGGDPDDFIALAARSHPVARVELEASHIHLSYVGTFLPRATALVRTVFRAFARLRAAEPALAARIRLNFIGTSNQAADTAAPMVRSIAEAEGIAEWLSERPQRAPYLSALDVLARSQGILLIGSDEPHYTASKIYPALMSGRPYLSLFHAASSAHAILSQAGGGCAFAFRDPAELAGLEQPIALALRRLAAAPDGFAKADPAAYESYSADSVARRFGAIFDRLALDASARL